MIVNVRGAQGEWPPPGGKKSHEGNSRAQSRFVGPTSSLLLLILPPVAESLAFWGFLGGSSSPPWVSLLSGREDEFLGPQERYLPLGAEAYGCSPPAAQTRKDLELLERATGMQ